MSILDDTSLIDFSSDAFIDMGADSKVSIENSYILSQSSGTRSAVLHDFILKNVTAENIKAKQILMIEAQK